jgi:hypothetical protein
MRPAEMDGWMDFITVYRTRQKTEVSEQKEISWIGEQETLRDRTVWEMERLAPCNNRLNKKTKFHTR